MARPSLYDPAYATRARILCRLGADKADLARAFAVSPATLYRWLLAHPRFAAAVATGSAEAETIVRPSLYQRATGYEVTAKRLFRRNTGEPVVARYRKRILADSRAALRWLRVRRPESWTFADRGTWPHGAPQRKHMIKDSVSQNSYTISEVMMDTIAEMILNGELKRSEIDPLIQHIFSGNRPPDGKIDSHVSSRNTGFTDYPSDTPSPMTSSILPAVGDEPHFIERPNPLSQPQPRLPRGQDEPECPVPHRLRRIPRGRHRSAARVRMIMPDHPHPRSWRAPAPRASMRREQRRRVYLEAPRRVSRHIRARLRLRDPPAPRL